jgi:large subunit ribosomal protein L6
MSRIGRLPISVPSGVTVTLDGPSITVKGPRGELRRDLHPDMLVAQEDGRLLVSRPDEDKFHRQLHGLTRTLVANMVEGVTNGYEKRLEIQGVGYRAALRGSSVELLLGFSHPVVVDPPAGIEFEIPAPTQIIVRGIDKQSVGQVAANIRRLRPPEPYKGKGIRYAGEVVRRKVGKRA